ncbi:hypothetical protein AK51_04475 [Serratia nematodiphila DZ0503SBS1]|nr:hypothetical protein AK51_04475 [Serratia nematodiphila DZ0503SBS1]
MFAKIAGETGCTMLLQINRRRNGLETMWRQSARNQTRIRHFAQHNSQIETFGRHVNMSVGQCQLDI